MLWFFFLFILSYFFFLSSSLVIKCCTISINIHCKYLFLFLFSGPYIVFLLLCHVCDINPAYAFNFSNVANLSISPISLFINTALKLSIPGIVFKFFMPSSLSAISSIIFSIYDFSFVNSNILSAYLSIILSNNLFPLLFISLIPLYVV